MTAPGVVVIQHGPGLDRFIEDRVEDLARHGYAAAAPDLYHRQPADGADMMARIGRLRDREIVSDVDATIAHMRAATRVAGRQPRGAGLLHGRPASPSCWLDRAPAAWRAAGVFYGGSIMKPWGDSPTPFDLTANITCPVVGFFGVEDTNPSPTT